MPISVPENRTQGAAISGVSRIIKLPVAYAFSVILRVAQGGAAYSPVLKCTIIVKNSIPARLTFFPSVFSTELSINSQHKRTTTAGIFRT